MPDGGSANPSAASAANTAAVALHPHLAGARPAGAVRVDCHSHTMWSGDCTTTPDELAAAVGASGIDVLCVTDHGTIAGAQALAEHLPCRVVTGQEQRTPEGELIGLFLHERIPPGMRSAREAALAIRDQGGLVYVPHPFDPMRHRLSETALRGLAGEGLVDAVEVLNAKTSLPHLNAAALAFALEHGLAAGAGSDAHVPEAVGAAYVEMPDFADAASFLGALRTGRIVGHHFDGARPWRPRIVPSTAGRRVRGGGGEDGHPAF